MWRRSSSSTFNCIADATRRVARFRGFRPSFLAFTPTSRPDKVTEAEPATSYPQRVYMQGAEFGANCSRGFDARLDPQGFIRQQDTL